MLILQLHGCVSEFFLVLFAISPQFKFSLNKLLMVMWKNVKCTDSGFRWQLFCIFNGAVRRFGCMRCLLHFHVYASLEAVGKKHWGSGCEAQCHWNLSDSSLSLHLCLSLSHSLSLSVCIYRKTSPFQSSAWQRQTLQRAEIYLELSLLS